MVPPVVYDMILYILSFFGAFLCSENAAQENDRSQRRGGTKEKDQVYYVGQGKACEDAVNGLGKGGDSENTRRGDCRGDRAACGFIPALSDHRRFAKAEAENAEQKMDQGEECDHVRQRYVKRAGADRPIQERNQGKHYRKHRQPPKGKPCLFECCFIGCKAEILAAVDRDHPRLAVGLYNVFLCVITNVFFVTH